VRGEKLEDIDNGLIEAVGARLQARLKTPLKMPEIKAPAAPASASAGTQGNEALRGPAAPSVPASVASAIAPTGKKRGRPAGWKKPAAPTIAESAEAEEEILVEHEDEVVSAPAMAATATLDDAVQALKLVNSTFNVDKARECLAHFKVARCSELTEAQRVQFVNHCRALCNV